MKRYDILASDMTFFSRNLLLENFFLREILGALKLPRLILDTF